MLVFRLIMSDILNWKYFSLEIFCKVTLNYLRRYGGVPTPFLLKGLKTPV